jgi:curved DNA-binding protein CbpA
MNLQECYKILGVSENASNDELAISFKRLAHKYHPDKNRDRIEWATRTMADINLAYNAIMSHRFEDSAEPIISEHEEEKVRRSESKREEHTVKGEYELFEREFLIDKFVDFRESGKESLYRYFQYGLFNLAKRDEIKNRGIFNEIVMNLRKTYHSIKSLMSLTSEHELLEHFTTFNEMIFNFYKASECLNILDSYKNIVDVEAYRSYKRGDETLHIAHKEIFYDRHNRGYFKREITLPYLLESEQFFRNTLRRFPGSSWSVETGIKLEYAVSLKKYFVLFFSE